MTVSSANVPIVMFCACGRSDVNSRYSMGPRALPWGTRELIGNKGETSAASVLIRVAYEARSTGIGVSPNSNLYVVIVVIVYANYGG
jgi:hypothetical protein